MNMVVSLPFCPMKQFEDQYQVFIEFCSDLIVICLLYTSDAADD